jgi:hypothetical protein
VNAPTECPKGFWVQGDQTLLAYKFRWIVDTIMGTRQGLTACGDVVSGVLYNPQQYYLVAPENRLFFTERMWAKRIRWIGCDP